LTDKQSEREREREREREGERGRGPRKKKSVGAVVIRCLPKTDPLLWVGLSFGLLCEFWPIPTFFLVAVVVWLLFFEMEGLFSDLKTDSIFV
jgi:hypothetical protein